MVLVLGAWFWISFGFGLAESAEFGLWIDLDLDCWCWWHSVWFGFIGWFGGLLLSLDLGLFDLLFLLYVVWRSDLDYCCRLFTVSLQVC